MRHSSPEARVAHQRSLSKARMQRARKAITRYKARPCKDCYGVFDPVCMDFDHVPERGTKIFEVSKGSDRSLRAVATEIAKCDVVCANCHRLRTKARRSQEKVLSI